MLPMQRWVNAGYFLSRNECPGMSSQVWNILNGRDAIGCNINVEGRLIYLGGPRL